ncbi:centromere protein T isoform X1 [Canis lupus baileyi]|uniref:Centromere protein T n=3 Tax=Canis lupus familiaris TaxID=9615 RepID=A0A8I3MYA6_CANLF|nr:centromere protein T isoform X1 [Canis lupus familiaris]XP_025282356.1 centromere protein T isoform X1 [Canis lupus dingo]XP_038394491.1 centromere protein T isoform X1 [Canis lupus familiaris]XP_038523218.1 centromere protein T isoform X1 [Canis lupus familiaris]|eukprot:XP_005620868.1 centromere protein T isoform X1 [Canis lupus familiaris]
MADTYNSDSEPTTRTLLRRVLDTADTRTPRRRRSARIGVQKARLEMPLSSPTKMNVSRRSQRARSIERLARVQTSGHLDEQTPRTLLKNILLTAPESSIMMPEPVVKPVPTPQVVQSSRRKSSQGSLELQLPELEPPTTLALGLLAPGRRKQRLRLSAFQQGVDQGLPLSQEPHGNANASSLTSSLNLTFATPLQPQSVQRPGLARRPPTRRAVDVGAFLQDLRDTSLVSPGDSLRTPVATLPTDTVLEDTQPFSQPLVGRSPSVYHSLPCLSHTEAEDAERAVSHRTQSSGPKLQNYNPGKQAQLLARKAKNVDAIAMSFPNKSSAISGEDGVDLLQDGIDEEAEERMEENLSVSEVMDTTGTQGSVRTENSKGYREMTEAVETNEPKGSSEDEDISDRRASPELASNTTQSPQARRPQFLEPAPPSSTAVLSSEPLSTRLPPRARAPGSRPRQDPHKTGLSHYVKFFSFCAKMPMEKKAVEMVEKCLDRYFQHLCDDLEAFAAHAGRKTVRPEDLELLMRRQGLVNDQVSLRVLVERHLPLEYRQLLIPCAFSGNSVFPAQ